MLFSDLTVMKMKGEIWVENVKPSVDNGKRYAKVTEGEDVTVKCDIISHGTARVDAAIMFRHDTEKKWRFSSLEFVDNDSWSGRFQADKTGLYRYRIVAWHDQVSTLMADCKKWLDAGEDIKEDLNLIKKLLNGNSNLKGFLEDLDKDPVCNANRMNWREIDYIKTHLFDVVKPVYAIPECAGYFRVRTLRSWKDLIP